LAGNVRNLGFILASSFSEPQWLKPNLKYLALERAASQATLLSPLPDRVEPQLFFSLSGEFKTLYPETEPIQPFSSF
jgi:hypothetical protein